MSMKLKKVLIASLFLLSTISAQQIGKMAPEPEPMNFPPNAWGVDLMISEAGFGLGTFLRQSFSTELTGFIDFSFSETKDNREVEYIDYYGQTYSIGKVNRVFLLPLYVGLQQRLFSHTLTDNLRPYINAAVGPTAIVSTPYAKEFFSAFGDAVTKVGLGGYIGFGANFGLSKSNLVGINVRYYYVQILDGNKVESLRGKFKDHFNSIYITINIGMMY